MALRKCNWTAGFAPFAIQRTRQDHTRERAGDPFHLIVGLLTISPSTPAEIQALERVLALAVSTYDEILERLSTHLSGENWKSPRALTVGETIERVLRLQRLSIDKKNTSIPKQGSAFGSNDPMIGASAFLALEVVIENAIAALPAEGRITIDAEMDQTDLK